MYCRKCGAKIEEGNTFCPKCGVNVEPKPAKKSSSLKSKILPFIVCCVLALIVFGALSSFFGGGDENHIDTSVPNKTLDSAMISEFMNNTTSVSSEYIPVESNDSVKSYSEPQSSSESSVSYVGNSNTKKFHSPYCSSADKIKDSNRVTFSSREDAISRGYTPCKLCNP